MDWWEHITAIGGLNVTGLGALAIAVWLGAARCWRLALWWCLLFGGAMAIAAVTQIAFLGWGIGIHALRFTGFSGHATRAAAVFPVAFFLLFEGKARWMRRTGVTLGVLIALAVAASRVVVHAHSLSEAVFGFVLGLVVARLFIRREHATHQFVPSPLLVALSLAILLLPKAEPSSAHQWMVGLALNLSGHDRPYTGAGWMLERKPYIPPCEREKIRFSYICT